MSSVRYPRQDDYEQIIAQLKQCAGLERWRGVGEAPVLCNNERIKLALRRFCYAAERDATHASPKDASIIYNKLADVAGLVNDILKEASSPTMCLNVLNKKYKAIEEKAHALDDPTCVFRRRVARALMGVGAALVLGAIATLAVSLSPLILAIIPAVGIGVGATGFGVSAIFGLAFVGGGGMLFTGGHHFGVYRVSDFSQTLFNFRDAVKDHQENRNKDDFSGRARNAVRKFMR